MGTFTKSFGAAGGYVAGSRETLSLLRLRSHAMCYAEAIAPPVLTQIVASMGSIMGVSPPLAPTAAGSDSQQQQQPPPSNALVPASMSKHEPYGPAPAQLLPGWLRLPPNLLDGSEGTDRLRRLAFNSRYLSCGLRKLGFIVYGHRDSPIVPLLTFNPAKMPLFSRMMSSRAIPIVTVIVGYPATPLPSSRSVLPPLHLLPTCFPFGPLADPKSPPSRFLLH
jgi:serine palmitoyltransferase